MKGRKKKSPTAPPDAAATPFFARFLESQVQDEDAEAAVSERTPRAPFTYARNAAKKSAAKKSASKKSAGKKSAATKRTANAKAPAATLKYPSDKDEFVLYPYHVEAARIGPGAGRQTLKYPSDNDEDAALAAVYVDRKDVPTTGRAKAKEVRVKVTLPRKDLYEAG